MVSPRTQQPALAREVLEGSWRGIIFQVDDASGTRGRRGEGTEYPYQDDPDFDDLGRAKRDHSVIGFLLGPGWEAQRDLLIEAVEQEGSGVLVHPWYGTLTCRCLSMSESHSSSELGVFRFTLELLQVRPDSDQQRVAPVQSQDATERVDRASDFLVEALLEEWVAVFALGDVPAFLQFGTSVAFFVSNPTYPGIQQAAWWRLSEDAREALLVFDSPAALEAALSLDSTAYSDLLADIFVRVDDLALIRQFFSYRILPDSFRASSTTPGRIAANTHLGLVYRFASGLIIAEWARLSVLEGYESATEARDERDEILGGLDDILGEPFRSGALFALMALRASVVRDFDRLLQQLAPVVRVRQPQVEPAIVTAHRFYEDVDRAEELLDLNDAIHPLFLPASGPLSALEW